jgi:RNA polymerase subunit RPABC4/transcription elongation factor Spt4
MIYQENITPAQFYKQCNKRKASKTWTDFMRKNLCSDCDEVTDYHHNFCVKCGSENIRGVRVRFLEGSIGMTKHTILGREIRED